MNRVDKYFDEIVMRDLKLKIVEAFLDLETNLRVDDFGCQEIHGHSSIVVNEKANQMKAELIDFIDSQVRRITKVSKVREHIENPKSV